MVENEQALKAMIRKEVEEVLDERERHSGVLVQEKKDDMARVLEAIGGVQNTIDKNHQEFKDFREEANFKFDFLIGEYKHLKKGQEALFEENQRFFDEFKSVHTELKGMRKEFSKRFDRIDGRLVALEKKEDIP